MKPLSAMRKLNPAKFRREVRAALLACGGNRVATAEHLGVSRRLLTYWLTDDLELLAYAINCAYRKRLRRLQLAGKAEENELPSGSSANCTAKIAEKPSGRPPKK